MQRGSELAIGEILGPAIGIRGLHIGLDTDLAGGIGDQRDAGDIVGPALRNGDLERDGIAFRIHQGITLIGVSGIREQFLRSRNVHLVVLVLVGVGDELIARGAGQAGDGGQHRNRAFASDLGMLLAVDNHVERLTEGDIIERLLRGVQEQNIRIKHIGGIEVIVFLVLVQERLLDAGDKGLGPVSVSVGHGVGQRGVVIVRNEVQRLGSHLAAPVILARRQHHGLGSVLFLGIRTGTDHVFVLEGLRILHALPNMLGDDELVQHLVLLGVH